MGFVGTYGVSDHMQLYCCYSLLVGNCTYWWLLQMKSCRLQDYPGIFFYYSTLFPPLGGGVVDICV